jgi:hypothetical protein
MMRLVNYVVVSTVALAACSKSPPEAIGATSEGASHTPSRTPYDKHLINDMLAYAYIKTHDFPDAAKAWEAELGDGFTTPAEQQQKVRGLCEVSHQLKNYDKAIDYGNRELKGGFGDAHIKTIVGQDYYLKGDWKGTLKFAGDLVDGTIKRGETPPKEPLQLIYSACFKLQDNGCATHALSQLKEYDPGTDPMAPQVRGGTALAYFFGPAEDAGQQTSNTSQDDSANKK